MTRGRDNVERKFKALLDSCVSAHERTNAVREFPLAKCRAAIEIDEYAIEKRRWYQLQGTVRRALESRIRRLEREAGVRP